MARGSVGDVTLYRANGQQLSRARNRHPRNPNSTKQAIQRAVSASVARLYSLTRALTDHSFQGLSVGQQNQRAFYKANMDILRALVVTALNDNLADTATNARVSAPGLSVAVPFVGAQMSSGTYAQQLFSFDAAVHGYKLPDPASAEETVAEYAARIGLVAGDIYTFIAIGVDSESVSPLYSHDISDPYASVYQPTFGYVQLMVKSGLSADTTAVTGKTFADLFTQAGGTTGITYLALTDDVSIDDINTTGSDHGCITCIRSRWDRDLRSNSFLMPATSEMRYGLTPANLLAAWRDKLGIDDVELILEGEKFAGVGGTVPLNITSTSISGITGLTAWPLEDTQKLNDTVTQNVQIQINGEGIVSAELRPVNYPQGETYVFTMLPDGTYATYSWQYADEDLKGHEWALYVNGNQYGGSLEFTA